MLRTPPFGRTIRHPLKSRLTFFSLSNRRWRPAHHRLGTHRRRAAPCGSRAARRSADTCSYFWRSRFPQKSLYSRLQSMPATSVVGRPDCMYMGQPMATVRHAANATAPIALGRQRPGLARIEITSAERTGSARCPEILEECPSTDTPAARRLAPHRSAVRDAVPKQLSRRQCGIGLPAGIDIRALGRAERAKHEFSRQPLCVLFSGHWPPKRTDQPAGKGFRSSRRDR